LLNPSSFSSPSLDKLLGVYCNLAILVPQARLLAQQLNKPILTKPPSALEAEHFVLCLSDQGLQLQATGKKAAGPIRVDFVSGASAHRRQFGGGKGQMIAKAIGLKGAYRPQVLDVTAGLGQDGFVLATLGCHMTLIERSPIVYHLLKDGLERTHIVADETLQSIVSRIQIQHCHSIEYLNQLDAPVDVIYLDPMFPERKTKAEVNKNMQAFHQLVGEDADAGALLHAALDKAIYRIVVKRSRKAPTIGEQYPDLSLPKPSVVFEGKSTRFDVYPLKKMP
jgi:16S rRNA (guanine1516-N2)-methyltransferase